MNAAQAEGAFWAAFLRNRNVDAGTAGDGAVAVAGGFAICVLGTDLRSAIGAGAARPLREDDCAVVAAFYASRGEAARFELDEDVLTRDGALVRDHGYTVTEATRAVLEAPVAVRQPVQGRIHVRTTTDRRAWAALVTEAAMGLTGDDAMALRTAQINAAAAHVLTVASLDGRDVGAGALGINGETALLFSAGVLPAFQRQGIYRALIDARLAIAHARGAETAVITAAPDGPAARGALRHGFVQTSVRTRLRRGS